MGSKKYISSIDGLRGITSLIIIIFHILYIPKPELAITDSIFFIRYFGRGVQLFFVISSFSLYLNYFGEMDSVEAIKKYYINRFSRIAPLFYLMIIFYIIFLKINNGVLIQYEDIIMNVFFIFGLFPDKHVGIVWASWSLGVLFLFYFIFPFLTLFIRNIKSSFIFLFISILLSYCSEKYFINHSFKWASLNFFTQLPTFSFGIIAFFCYQKFSIIRSKIIKNILIYIPIICLIFMPLFNRTIAKNIYSNYLILPIWSFIFGLLVFSQSVNGLLFFDNYISRFLGRISYSTYLIHPIIVFSLRNVYLKLYSLFNLNINLLFILCCILTLLLVIPISTLSYAIIENPIGRIVKKYFIP